MTPRNFDSLKCIWMSSGIVDYRLCHLDFDCDNCEFDKAIRNRGGSATDTNSMARKGIFEELREKSSMDDYGANSVYISGNYIMRRVFQNSHLITFPFFFWRWMEPVARIRCRVERGYRQRGEPLFYISGEWGKIEAPAPFDLYMLSSFVEENSAPFFGAWLGLLETDDGCISGQTLNISHSRQTAANILQKLEQEFSASQAMMQDGGIELPYLYQVIGKERLCTLLASLFTIS